jgi:hypothetical protein
MCQLICLLIKPVVGEHSNETVNPSSPTTHSGQPQSHHALSSASSCRASDSEPLPHHGDRRIRNNPS